MNTERIHFVVNTDDASSICGLAVQHRSCLPWFVTCPHCRLLMSPQTTDTETELIDMALAVSAASGAVADAVKKAVFHAHGVDWPLLLTLAEVLRVNAATLAMTAEQQIEQRAAQGSLDIG